MKTVGSSPTPHGATSPPPARVAETPSSYVTTHRISAFLGWGVGGVAASGLAKRSGYISTATVTGWIIGPLGANAGGVVGTYIGRRLGGGAGASVSGATGAFLGGLSGAPPSHSVSAPSVELSPASWVGSSLGSCMPSLVPSGPCFNDLIPDAQQPR